MDRDRTWFDIDWWLLASGLFLGLLGIVVISGATHGDPLKDTLWLKQGVWIMLGIGLAFACTFLNYRRILRWSPLIYVLALVLLAIVLTSDPVKGARSWIDIPGLPFRVQPSEFGKVGLILILARYLGKWQGRVDGFGPVIAALVLTAIPTVLVLAQPDMGTALVYLPICVTMLFAAGLHPAYFVLLASPILGMMGLSSSAAMLCLWVVLVSLVLVWGVWSKVSYGILVLALFLNMVCFVGIQSFGSTVWEHAPTHAKKRIISYIDEDFEPKKAGWNARQSRIALGSGGFWGHGWGKGTQSKLKFLPEVQHDFVFAVLGEQWGFFGCTLLLGLFVALFARCALVAATAADTEGLLICVGAVAMYATHVVVNTGMATGLLPITGLPLTFISYGGAFMLTNLLVLGLVCSVSFRRAIRIE